MGQQIRGQAEAIAGHLAITPTGRKERPIGAVDAEDPAIVRAAARCRRTVGQAARYGHPGDATGSAAALAGATAHAARAAISGAAIRAASSTRHGAARADSAPAPHPDAPGAPHAPRPGGAARAAPL